LAVVLAACGGDSPDAVEGALGEAAPTLAYVEPSEGSCVAGVLINTVGFDQLATEGHTSESITLSPDESIDTILESHDSDELRGDLAGCLEVSAMIRAELVATNGDADLACNTEFDTGTNFVDEYIDGQFDGDAVIDIDDTSENRDLLRSCLDEASFAETFDIDTRAELQSAIEDNLGRALRDDSEPCLAPLVIDHFGSAEATNEAGITVESPDFELADLNDIGAENDFLDAVYACSLLAEREAESNRTAEPVFVQCLANGLAETPTWQRMLTSTALGTLEEAKWVRRAHLDTCVRDRVDEVFGSTSTKERRAGAEIGIDYYWEFGGPDSEYHVRFGETEALLECAGVAVALGTDLDRLDELEELARNGNRTPELLQTWDDMLGLLGDGIALCAQDDFLFIAHCTR